MKKKGSVIIIKWGLILGAGVSLLRFLNSYLSNLDIYPFGPVLDLLMVLLFIGTLYLGIKDYRDDILDGEIKFGKAYLLSFLISLLGFFIVFFYLNIHYSVIDKEELNKLNLRNEAKYIEKIEKDTVTQKDLMDYVRYTQERLAISGSESCNAIISPKLDTLRLYYEIRMMNRKLPDADKFELKNFDGYARKNLVELAEITLQQQDLIDSGCEEEFKKIIAATLSGMEQNSLLNRKIDEGKSTIPRYDNIFAAALYFSLSVLIYGLLFGLFVSLYLYRKKKDPDTEEAEEKDGEDEMNNEINE